MMLTNQHTNDQKNIARPPVPDSKAGQQALKALLQHRNVLAALEALYAEMGEVFQIPLPGFSPVFLVGPQANRFVTITHREDLRWRSEGDPVAAVLRHGLLMTDGELHDHLRHTINPPLHKGRLAGYLEKMAQYTDQVMAAWGPLAHVDMLVEMRKIALLIVMGTLFKVDLSPDLKRMWPVILKTLAYISPGLWVVMPRLPRLGYRGALEKLDHYLYQVIADRRAAQGEANDMLGAMIRTPGMTDDLIRDQLLTILIAGHDTSTALLAWTLYLLGSHPLAMQAARAEIAAVLGQDPSTPTIDQLNRLDFLDRVTSEALRMYPPIHLGNRIAAVDLDYHGYHIPAGTRVVYSIYLSHRQPEYWPEPQRFDPDRFLPENTRTRPHYTYMPFGGGPRNCIGMAFAQVEAKLVLARLLQNYDLQLTGKKVHPHMGATLEPRPGVLMQVRKLNS